MFCMLEHCHSSQLQRPPWPSRAYCPSPITKLGDYLSSSFFSEDGARWDERHSLFKRLVRGSDRDFDCRENACGPSCSLSWLGLRTTTSCFLFVFSPRYDLPELKE